MEIPFLDKLQKTEESELRKKEDAAKLRELRSKQKLTFKQKQIIASKGYRLRVRRDGEPMTKEEKQKNELERMVAQKNVDKKREKAGRVMLEKYYALILKLIRLHYKKRVFRVALRGLLKFINRMPVAFVSQILNNLQSIYLLIESEQNQAEQDDEESNETKQKKGKKGKKGKSKRESDTKSKSQLDDKARKFLKDKWANKLRLIRTMHSLWGKLNFEGQLESHYLQRKLYSCFLEWIKQQFGSITEDNPNQPREASNGFETEADKETNEISEDLFVNFENLVVKPLLSNSGTVSNWFILLFKLAAISKRPKLANTALFMMNKMMERYPKLAFLLDPSDVHEEESEEKFAHGNLKISGELTYCDNKSLSLCGYMKVYMAGLKRNNRGKYLAECLVNRTGLGKKYIGIDLRRFLSKF